MKYCTKCGAELMDEAVICTKCGCSTGQQKNYLKPKTTSVNANNLCPTGYALTFMCLLFFSIALTLTFTQLFTVGLGLFIFDKEAIGSIYVAYEIVSMISFISILVLTVCALCNKWTHFLFGSQLYPIYFVLGFAFAVPQLVTIILNIVIFA